jgi:DNA-binding transcriptional MerR regulator
MDSAITLVKMDKELFKIFDKLEQNGLPVKQIKPILEHYESKDEEGLKNKISSIKSFKGLTTPSVKLDNGKYIPDFNSRYFTADFPYGLEILLSIARLLNTEHPTMDEVDGWYRRVSHNPDKGFNLKDIGINSEKEFLEIYK